jgi:hypothetical protein
MKARNAIPILTLAAALALFAGEAPAQSYNSVQDRCAYEGAVTWPEHGHDNVYYRARQQVYTNCMMRHGLRP